MSGKDVFAVCAHCNNLLKHSGVEPPSPSSPLPSRFRSHIQPVPMPLQSAMHTLPAQYRHSTGQNLLAFACS